MGNKTVLVSGNKGDNFKETFVDSSTWLDSLNICHQPVSETLIWIWFIPSVWEMYQSACFVCPINSRNVQTPISYWRISKRSTSLLAYIYISYYAMQSMYIFITHCKCATAFAVNRNPLFQFWFTLYKKFLIFYCLHYPCQCSLRRTSDSASPRPALPILYGAFEYSIIRCATSYLPMLTLHWYNYILMKVF